MDDRKSQPTILLFLVALLGLASLPRWTPPEAPGPKSSLAKTEGGTGPAGESASSGPSTSSENPDLQVLAPLIDLAHDGAGRRIGDERPTPAFGDCVRRRVIQELVERLGGTGGSVHGLIALLPDPVRTSVGHEYDSDLDGLQRAMERAGFILEAARFPWGEPGQPRKSPPEKPRDVNVDLALPYGSEGPWKVAGKLSSSDDSTKEPTPKPDEHPGLMVFRNRKLNRVLAVLLALETPTRGLNKPQFVWSLDLVDAIADAGAPASPRTIPILGPCYSGTAPTLSQALQGWLKRPPSERLPGGAITPPSRQRCYAFSIVASASELTAADFENTKDAEVKFRAVLNKRRDLTKVLINHLTGDFGQVPGRQGRVALLVESNTGFGKAAIFSHPNIFSFPIHISSLRASYEKQGLLRDQSSQVFRSAGRLDLPAEADERTRDVLPSMTPEFSTRVDELVMVQTLTDIARGRYDAVGITATSSRDIIFLAQMIRRFHPDAQIFTNKADLLFTQPQTISDLRGMLIGSTYPLYAPNRHWSYPFGTGPDVFFNQEAVQGIYNATMFLLNVMFPDDDKIRTAAIPLEFGKPFDVGSGSSYHPPVWIGVVGNRGIYPLQVVDRTDPEEGEGTARWLCWPAVINRDGRPEPGFDFDSLDFRPSYHMFWKVLQTLLLMLVLVMAYLAYIELLWARAKGGWGSPKFLGPLAQSLVWIRVPPSYLPNDDWAQQDSPELGPGPGPHLVFAHLALFLIFLALNWPFFVSIRGVPINTYLDCWAIMAWVGCVVLSVSLGISIMAAFRLETVLRYPWIWVLILGAVAFGILLAVWWFVPLDANPRLTLERIVLVTSGVSPTFPLAFVGLGVASCLAAELRRRYLNEQIAFKDLKLAQGKTGSPPAEVARSLAQVDSSLEDLRKVFQKPLRVFRRPPLVPTLLFGFFGVYLALAWFTLFVLEPWTPTASPERWVFRVVFGGLFLVLAVLLTLRVYHLFVLWGYLSDLLRQVARLPMARSFDRLPARIARWFFESPLPKNRSVMVKHQAAALADRCVPSVLGALAGAFSLEITSGEWEKLIKNLKSFDQLEAKHPCVPESPGPGGNGPAGENHLKAEPGATGAHVASVAVLQDSTAAASRPGPSARPPQEKQSPLPSVEADLILLKILTRIWKGMPLSWVFAEGKAKGDEGKAKDDAGGGDWPIAPKAADVLSRWPASPQAGDAIPAEASGSPPEDRPEAPGSKTNAESAATAPGARDMRRAVRDWAETAEDLISMQLLRHLSQFLAHLWIMIGFVVVGLFALLLAINSYPFPLQNRIQFFLAVLITLAAVAILRIVLGINRDETVSRVANTLPGQLKLNRDLASGLFVYILPLIGILAAVSYDVSDLLRVWLDPVFRNLM